MPEFDPFAWSTTESQRIRALASDSRVVGPGSLWISAREVAFEGAADIDMFRRFAPGNAFFDAAQNSAENSGYANRYLRAMADLLERFVTAYQSGLVSSVPYAVPARVDQPPI